VTTLCGYRVLSELSPGKSWLAEGPGERRVVLKKLPADCLFNGKLRDSIRDRLGRVREIAHMGVASLIGVEKQDEAAYLVWEYVEGGQFEPSEEMNKELIRSVELFHSLGLVHGAIYKGNVIVREGEVYLIDVSPLLYDDPQVDVQGVAKLLGKENTKAKSLRELESKTDAPVPVGEIEKERTFRYGALAAAVALAMLGALTWWAIWFYATGNVAK